MICATEQLELVVQLPAGRTESRDTLAQLSRENLKVHACSSYCGSDGLVLLLIVEEPVQALAALRSAGYDCRSQPVLVIELPRYDVGVMVRVTKELEQAGVFILRSHVALLGQGALKVALQTSDNRLARHILQSGSSNGAQIVEDGPGGIPFRMTWESGRLTGAQGAVC
jgi:hypothetical protein